MKKGVLIWNLILSVLFLVICGYGLVYMSYKCIDYIEYNSYHWDGRLGQNIPNMPPLDGLFFELVLVIFCIIDIMYGVNAIRINYIFNKDNNNVKQLKSLIKCSIFFFLLMCIFFYIEEIPCFIQDIRYLRGYREIIINAIIIPFSFLVLPIFLLISRLHYLREISDSAIDKNVVIKNGKLLMINDFFVFCISTFFLCCIDYFGGWLFYFGKLC